MILFVISVNCLNKILSITLGSNGSEYLYFSVSSIAAAVARYGCFKLRPTCIQMLCLVYSIQPQDSVAQWIRSRHGILQFLLVHLDWVALVNPFILSDEHSSNCALLPN